MSLRDELAADTHDSWMKTNERNGVTSRISSITGEEQMVPFERLSDPVKQFDYDLIDTILESLKQRGYIVLSPDAVKMIFAGIVPAEITNSGSPD